MPLLPFVLLLDFDFSLFFFFHLLLEENLLILPLTIILNLILPLNNLIFDSLVLDAFGLAGIFYSVEGFVVYLC